MRSFTPFRRLKEASRSLGSAAGVDALFQRFFQVQTGGTAEYHQVEQRVAAQAVGAVYRYAGHFAHGEQAFDDLVVAVGVLGDGLAMDVGGNAAHHVVAGRDHRDRRDDRVDVGEGLGQFADAGQAAVQDFLAEVVELQQHVVLVRAHAVAGQDFLDHGTGDHVAAGQVLRVRRITLHEALAVGVDQVTAFAAATFGDQYTGAGDAGRVELPHLDVLHRHAGTQGHAHAVTGVDQRVGGGGVDTAGTASGQDHGLGTDVDGLAGLDADGDDADHRAVLVLHQVDRVPLVEERGAILQVGLVQGVQQRVAGTVGGGAGTGGLATLAEVLGLAAERTLVDAAGFGTGERQAHVLEPNTASGPTEHMYSIASWSPM